MEVAWCAVCADPADGGKKVDYSWALGEVSVDGKELAVEKGM